MPNTTPARCDSFALSLLVANRGNTQQISFGLSRTCTEQIQWVITFVLKQRGTDGNFFDRVNFSLNVTQEAPGKTAQAERLQNGLTPNQIDFVQGPMAAAAERESTPTPVPAGLLARPALRSFAAAFADDSNLDNLGEGASAPPSERPISTMSVSATSVRSASQ